MPTSTPTFTTKNPTAQGTWNPSTAPTITATHIPSTPEPEPESQPESQTEPEPESQVEAEPEQETQQPSQPEPEPEFLSDSTGAPDFYTSRKVDGDLYRAASGAKAFNVTTVRMESEFNEINAQNEIQIVYDYYAPSDTVNTSYDLRLYEKNCVTHGLNSNVESKYITVAQADPLYARNNQEQVLVTLKSDGDQVHLAGHNWNQQARLEIPLDIHQGEIFLSPYFAYEPGSHYTVAHIEFCARFVMFYDIDNDGNFNIWKDDPYKEIEAVQFHETVVKLTFNLTQDFQVSDISLQKDAIINRSDNQRLKYELDVYHCEPKPGDITEVSSDVVTPYGGNYPSNYAIANDSYTKAPTRVITQSTIVYICLALTGSSANIGIREIAQLELIQPKSQITSFAIHQRTPNAITTESHYGAEKRKRMVVSTRLVLPFFDNRNPALAGDEEIYKKHYLYDEMSSSNVIAKGTVIMMFQNDNDASRHLLGLNRDLHEAGEEVEEPFEVELSLGYDEYSSGHTFMAIMALSFAGVLSFVAII